MVQKKGESDRQCPTLPVILAYIEFYLEDETYEDSLLKLEGIERVGLTAGDGCMR